MPPARRTATLLLALSVALPSARLHAGHGLMNSFGDVEWLPEPGRTPDQVGYFLDKLLEQANLALADKSQRMPLALVYAREKLAETDAMVRADNRQAADLAVAAYVAYLGQAAHSLAAVPASEHAAQATALAGALLEHRYIISVDYLDLPRATRSAIGPAVKAASEHYEAIVQKLPKSFKSAQFFKEEEVRWSWEMAEQADAQGL
jgi:hypothetical protein